MVVVVAVCAIVTHKTKCHHPKTQHWLRSSNCLHQPHKQTQREPPPEQIARMRHNTPCVCCMHSSYEGALRRQYVVASRRGVSMGIVRSVVGHSFPCLRFSPLLQRESEESRWATIILPQLGLQQRQRQGSAGRQARPRGTTTSAEVAPRRRWRRRLLAWPSGGCAGGAEESAASRVLVHSTAAQQPPHRHPPRRLRRRQVSLASLGSCGVSVAAPPWESRRQRRGWRHPRRRSPRKSP